RWSSSTPFPYTTLFRSTVEIEEFVHNGTLIDISALILVERATQKAIVIGDGGSRIKQIGQDARKDMEVMFYCKVMLKLWVKVKADRKSTRLNSSHVKIS